MYEDISHRWSGWSTPELQECTRTIFTTCLLIPQDFKWTGRNKFKVNKERNNRTSHKEFMSLQKLKIPLEQNVILKIFVLVVLLQEFGPKWRQVLYESRNQSIIVDDKFTLGAVASRTLRSWVGSRGASTEEASHFSPCWSSLKHILFVPQVTCVDCGRCSILWQTLASVIFLYFSCNSSVCKVAFVFELTLMQN